MLSSSASLLAFADRRAKSFSRSWSDPTPVKPDSLHDSRDSESTHIYRHVVSFSDFSTCTSLVTHTNTHTWVNLTMPVKIISLPYLNITLTDRFRDFCLYPLKWIEVGLTCLKRYKRCHHNWIFKYATIQISKFVYAHQCYIYLIQNTTQIPEMLGSFFNLNKMKTKEFQITWANILFTIEHR